MKKILQFRELFAWIIWGVVLAYVLFGFSLDEKLQLGATIIAVGTVGFISSLIMFFLFGRKKR